MLDAADYICISVGIWINIIYLVIAKKWTGMLKCNMVSWYNSVECYYSIGCLHREIEKFLDEEFTFNYI